MEEIIEENMGMDIRALKMLGMVMLVLGLVAIFFPVMMSGIVVFLVAFILILMGGMFLSLAIYGGENEKSWMTWVKAFIMLGVGMLMLMNPHATASVLALMLGILFFFIGFMALLMGYAIKPGEGWYLFIADSVVAFLLGIILFVGWPEHSTKMLGLLLGLDLLMEGITIMVIASSVEKNVEDKIEKEA